MFLLDSSGLENDCSLFSWDNLLEWVHYLLFQEFLNSDAPPPMFEVGVWEECQGEA